MHNWCFTLNTFINSNLLSSTIMLILAAVDLWLFPFVQPTFPHGHFNITNLPICITRLLTFARLYYLYICISYPLSSSFLNSRYDFNLNNSIWALWGTNTKYITNGISSHMIWMSLNFFIKYKQIHELKYWRNES